VPIARIALRTRRFSLLDYTADVNAHIVVVTVQRDLSLLCNNVTRCRINMYDLKANDELICHSIYVIRSGVASGRSNARNLSINFQLENSRCRAIAKSRINTPYRARDRSLLECFASWARLDIFLKTWPRVRAKDSRLFCRSAVHDLPPSAKK
jgi:hypothetical protein